MKRFFALLGLIVIFSAGGVFEEIANLQKSGTQSTELPAASLAVELTESPAVQAEPADSVSKAYLPYVGLGATPLPEPRTELPVTALEARLKEPVAEAASSEWSHAVHLADFANSVASGSPDQLVGVYVPDVFSLPVLQQPQEDAAFVSTENETVTQFSLPSRHNVVGLLAHNYLSGKKFFELEMGQEFALVYGDLRVQYYRITQVEEFQALSPSDPYSNFINLADPEQKVISSSQLFEQIYTTENQVVFQTCIEAFGNASWGRIFLIAEPIEAPGSNL